ncbi:isoleucine--tRNA ligase [Christensenellaceae bacterium OttesenSCG-928-L17]|nr:isoleucine--tRNA ligase [Christensenellaceae bacterium OttesenSCG-928-L17]
MYKKVPTDLNFVPRELEVLDFWKEVDIFHTCTEHRKGGEPWTFFDGPPTANGKPHIGHVLTRCIKDIIPRYKSMKGFNVMRKAGWDTHGLPVELEVEKTLGLDGKEQIEAYGVEEFIKKCKESVWKYKSEWEDMSDRVAFWADMDDPYITYENNYIESVWWSLKEIHNKGLLYKGHKVVPYCPRCGTALSSHEVAQGYEDVKDISCTAKFRVKGEENTYVLAWTTTPWTLPSNVSLCVNADEEYARVKKDGEVYILARALVNDVLGEDAEVLSVCKGKDLVGLDYEPLFDYPIDTKGKRGFYVMSDPYVTLTDGTGVVHNAPAFGEDDYRLGREWDLPFLQFVNAEGNLCGGTHWDGMYVKDANFAIIDKLKEQGQLFSADEFEHNYPFCWRCHTPLIYYARASWFIKMTAVRDKLVDFNRRVWWVPDNIKEGRMGNFVENVIDWGISRERYWGTPLPVWVCADCNEVHVVGSIAELKEMGKDVPDEIELHKPYIDAVHLNCPKCGGDMARVSEVIDCWYDSGAMSFAQFHYPFENKELFAQRYPADFISEAIDQTRGWFYTLLAISTCLFDDPAFLSCVVMGHVQDKDGHKMSKHIGNVVDPWEALNKQGADAVRWYFFTASMPWLPNRFYDDAVNESQRKFMGTLWNTYAFYVLYAEIDQFNPNEHQLVRENLTEMDRFILSRLNTVAEQMNNHLDMMRITEAGRLLQSFVDELSNWYVRRCRERFWGKEMTADKEAAYMTLYTVLEVLNRLSAPFVPFMTEQIYQNIVRSVQSDALISVHLCDYPEADASFIDTALEKHMEDTLKIVVLGRAARNTAAMKNRQPLACMYVQGDALPEGYVRILREELNVKDVRFVADASSFVSYRAKPQLKTLGPRYGKVLPAINEYLAKEGVGDLVVEAHNAGNAYRFEVSGVEVSLERDDVLIEPMQKQGFVSVTENGLSVVLDTNLTPELVDEGFVRELVSKIQTMRKEAGFDVTDHIALTYECGARMQDIFARFGEEIAGDTLSDTITAATPAGFVKEWDINGEAVTLGVEKR